MSEWGNRIVGRIFVVENLELDDEVWSVVCASLERETYVNGRRK